MRMSDWSSDVCASDLPPARTQPTPDFIVTELCRSGSEKVLGQAPCSIASSPSSQAGSPGSPAGRRPSSSRPSSSSCGPSRGRSRSEEHTSELQSLMRISYAVFCLKKKKKNNRSVIDQYSTKDYSRTEI